MRALKLTLEHFRLPNFTAVPYLYDGLTKTWELTAPSSAKAGLGIFISQMWIQATNMNLL